MRRPQNMLLPIWLSSRKLSLSKLNVGSLHCAKGSLHLSNNALSDRVVDVTVGVVVMRHLIRSGMRAFVDDSFDAYMDVRGRLCHRSRLCRRHAAKRICGNETR